MSKRWLTIIEIIEAKLPGMPASKRSIYYKAARQSWPSRPRKGKGGGVEYAISALPQAAQEALASRAVRALPKTATPQMTDPGLLAGWQRNAMQARALILNHIQAIALTQGASLLAIEAQFARQAAARTLPPALAEAVAAANRRQGQKGRTVSAATLRRWRMLAGENSVTLAPKYTPQPLDYPWLARFMQLYARPTRPSIAWCVEEMRREGVDAPPLRTVQAVIARMGAISRHRGRVGARDLKRFRAYTARTIDDLEPLDVISADGHCFKAEVRHPLHGGVFRPEIVTVIDIATRKVIGWSAGLAESALVVADALRIAAEQGIAALLYTDNGCGFVNAFLDGPGLGVLARLGTTHCTAIAYNAQARGAIERLQASLWKREAKTLPSYVGHDMDREARHVAFKKGRAELKAVGSSRLYLEWPEFLAWCGKAIARYNARPHSGLPRCRNEGGRMAHESPNDAFARHKASGWQPIIAAQDALDDLFRPAVTRKVQRASVSLFGSTYFSRILDDLDMHGQEVQVGYDIHDVSRVWVRDEDGRFLCIAGRDAHASPYFAKSHIERAQEKRTRQCKARLARQLAEVEAEGRGARPIEAAQLTPEQEERAARQLAFLIPQTQRQTGTERPVFADDPSWVEWLAANPSLATTDDRMHLEAALRQPSFRQLLEFSGVDCQALSRLASAAIRQIA